jgi:hypothetical protein
LTWNGVRDAALTGAVIAGNYFLPGSSILTGQLVSKGAQANLNTTDGMIANIVAGGAGAAQGNMSNYGKIANAAGLGDAANAAGVPGAVGDKAAALQAANPTLTAAQANALANAGYDANMLQGVDAAQLAQAGDAIAASGGLATGIGGTGITAGDLVKYGLPLLTGDNGQGAANDASINAANSAQGLAQVQANIALENQDNYRKTFVPVEQAWAKDALNAGSAENIASEGAIAGANAEQQASIANAAKVREQQRMGVNPNSGNAMALADANATNDALLRTGAVNTARKNTLDSAFNKRQNVVNAGRGIQSNAQTGLNNATSGFNQASQNQAQVAQNAANNNQAIGGLINTVVNSPVGQKVGGYIADGAKSAWNWLTTSSS